MKGKSIMLRLGLLGVFAGLAGGIAEILWVGMYSFLTPLEAAEVAEQVALSVFPTVGGASPLVAAGISIHLLLSVALGLAYRFAVWPLMVNRQAGAIIVSSIVVLAAVWAINFFVVLPLLNPAFVILMPYAVTFISKMLFAIAMGIVLSNTKRLPSFALVRA